MKNMFANSKEFNQNLSRWNVSNYTRITSMFKGAISFDTNINNFTKKT